LQHSLLSGWSRFEALAVNAATNQPLGTYLSPLTYAMK
jgi:hypothetical protein